MTYDLAGALPAPCLVGAITADALQAWARSWAPHPPRPEGIGGWDWSRIAAVYHRRVDALTLAVWSGDVLCGLMAAQPSKGHQRLRLEFLEGSPDRRHPLRGHVLDVGILVGVRYTQALGARTLRLVDPAPGLIDRYRARYGFGPAEFEGGGSYCELRT